MPRIPRLAHALDPGGVARTAVIASALAVISPGASFAQPGMVLTHQKISHTQGGFTGGLDNDDRLGVHVTALGDLDGDGVADLAVGAGRDDDGGPDRGAVWILFLNSDGTVKSHQKISSTQGSLTGPLTDGDQFSRPAAIGDLDKDGVVDLAVGAFQDSDGAAAAGAVWILFLNADGTVKGEQKISATQGGFGGALDADDHFGWSVAKLGDLDGDGLAELAVGANGDDDGNADAGAVWVLFLNGDGTVKAHQKISALQGGFAGVLSADDNFGHSVAPLADLDRDGVRDLAVGAYGADDGDQFGSFDRGAVWMLFLNPDGTVKSHKRISDTNGGFTGVLDNSDRFSAVMALPDVNGDHIQDLAVGAPEDDDGAGGAGAVWILFLNTNGRVQGHQKISATTGGFTGTLDPSDWFAWHGAFVGDLDGDGHGELAIGAIWDDDPGGAIGSDRGAVWILSLDGPVLTSAPDVEAHASLSLATVPNPFGGRVALQYSLPAAGAVRLRIHDARGRVMATLVEREQGAGRYSATWSGRNRAEASAASGVYFARLEVDGRSVVRKIVHVR